MSTQENLEYKTLLCPLVSSLRPSRVLYLDSNSTRPPHQQELLLSQKEHHTTLLALPAPSKTMFLLNFVKGLKCAEVWAV